MTLAEIVDEMRKSMEEIMSRTHCETYYGGEQPQQDCIGKWPGLRHNWCIACLAQSTDDQLTALSASRSLVAEHVIEEVRHKLYAAVRVPGELALLPLVDALIAERDAAEAALSASRNQKVEEATRVDSQR